MPNGPRVSKHEFRLLLLPLFFAYTGLRTSIGLVSGTMWWSCLAIVLVAIAGKLVGTGLAARIGGFGWRESLALGALMNTRGLMGLVVVNVGLDTALFRRGCFP